MTASISRKISLSAGLALVFCLVLEPSQAEGAYCSTARAAGDWAYTYTGSILTPNGFVPAAAVGHSTGRCGQHQRQPGSQRRREFCHGRHLWDGHYQRRLHRHGNYLRAGQRRGSAHRSDTGSV